MRLRLDNMSDLRRTIGVAVLAAAALWSGLVPTPAASGFEQVRPGYPWSFPRDHASHPGFKTEWWYLTGHLESGGRHFGYQLTFFRSALKGARGADSSRQVYFAHFAVGQLDGGRFRFFEKMSRGGLGVAGASEKDLRVWNGGWRLEGGNGPQRLRAEAAGVALELDLAALKPPTVHGRDRISRKGREPGHASYYYSLTRLDTHGTLWLDGASLPVRGASWMDHEFSSDQLSPQQKGWDWFSVQLSDGTDLMIYRMRLGGGGADPASSGTLIGAGGGKTDLSLAQFRVEPLGTWVSPHTGATYPSGWRLTLPAEGLSLEVIPQLQDQELVTRHSRITYWEGACAVRGTHNGRLVTGQGFVELTGYAGPLRF